MRKEDGEDSKFLFSKYNVTSFLHKIRLYFFIDLLFTATLDVTGRICNLTCPVFALL